MGRKISFARGQAADRASRGKALKELSQYRGSLPADFKYDREEANARTKVARVAKWGNSLAVRLPASMVDDLKLKAGDEVRLTPTASGVLGVGRPLTVKERLDRLERFRGRMPADFKFDREEANRR